MVLVLHQSGVSHGHQHERQGGCNHENASVRAAFVHVLGDLVQSVGVLVAAAIIHFWVCVRGTFMCSLFRKAKDGSLASAETITAHFIFGSCVPHSLNIKQQIQFAHFCSRLWFWGRPSRSRRMFSGY